MTAEARIEVLCGERTPAGTVRFPGLSDGWVILSIGIFPQGNGAQPLPGFPYNGILTTDTPGDGALWCRQLHVDLYGGVGPLPAGFRDGGPVGYTLSCDPNQRGTGPTNTWLLECTQESCVGTFQLPMVNAASFGSSEAYGETERRDNGGGVFGTAPASLVSAFAYFPKSVPVHAQAKCDPAVGNTLGGLTVVDQINAKLPRDLVRSMSLDRDSYAKVVLRIDPIRDPGVKQGDDGRPDRTSNSVDILLKPVR